MLRTYHIKWFFILTGILTISTLFLYQGKLSSLKWWEFPDYAIHITALLFIGWLINGYFLTRTISLHNNYTKHFLSIFLATIITFALDYFLFQILPQTDLISHNVGFDTVSNIINHLTGAFFLGLICYVVFYSVHTNSALQNAKLDNEILEQAHLRAQLLSLQQQISPHFLFNSLSTLKTIAGDQPTKNYVVQLAAVYRYVLNFNESYLSPLKDELAFIKSYLYIMNERFEEALQVTINIPDEYLQLLIPPLSLQLLIENAIKHNVISNEQPLHITIMTNDSPALVIKNNTQPKKIPEEGTGTGLKNIRERYRLLIQLPVEILNTGSTFSVTLPLLKNESNHH
jgi:two-component system LytT family sensor kinase